MGVSRNCRVILFRQYQDFDVWLCFHSLLFTNELVLCFSAGGGAESEAYYPQWRRINQSIERPSALNESLIRLIEGTWSNLLLSSLERAVTDQ